MPASPPAQPPLILTICMGSSCYSRGNSRNIEAIQQFIAEKQLDATIQLVGHLCEDKCRNGPNLGINGKIYQQVDTASAIALINDALNAKPA